jgi:hypothetical protein
MKTITRDHIISIVHDALKSNQESPYELVAARINEHFNTPREPNKLTGELLIRSFTDMLTGITWADMPAGTKSKWDAAAKEIVDIVLDKTPSEPITEKWLMDHGFDFNKEGFFKNGLVFFAETNSWAYIGTDIPTPANTHELEVLMKGLGIL